MTIPGKATTNIAIRIFMAKLFERTDIVTESPKSHGAMNIGEILIWESSNLLLLIPRLDRAGDAAGALASAEAAAFTERDWFLLFGHPHEKVLTLRL
jgi:hypothetical protein